MKPSATAIVSPANPPKTPLVVSGEHPIKVIGVRGENDGLKDKDGNPAMSEHQEVTLEYPDGSKKTHQVKNGEDLFAQIAVVMRSRLGVFEFIFKTPAELPEAGAEIMIEV